MSGHIQPGDLVVHVGTDCDLSEFCGELLVIGRCYRVEDISLSSCCGRGLILVEDLSFDRDRGFCPAGFRKIDAADEQFTNHIRALKPVREDA